VKAGLDLGDEPVLLWGHNVLSCLDYNLGKVIGPPEEKSEIGLRCFQSQICQSNKDLVRYEE